MNSKKSNSNAKIEVKSRDYYWRYVQVTKGN